MGHVQAVQGTRALRKPAGAAWSVAHALCEYHEQSRYSSETVMCWHRAQPRHHSRQSATAASHVVAVFGSSPSWPFSPPPQTPRTPVEVSLQ